MFPSFQPPERLLLGPGPSPVPASFLAALAKPTLGHLDPAFVGLMDEIKTMLRAALQTKNALTIPISAPGSAGMEACLANLIEPGDSVVICSNGVFGGRMRENALRMGAKVILVEDAFGQPVDANKVEDALRANPGVKLLGFVHAETSTGVRSDAQTLCALARKHGALSVVDAVTSLGGIELAVDDWGIDALYSGSQKCLSAPPGLSPLTFSDAAVAALKARTHKVQSWFLDLSLVMSYWSGEGARSYHHTAPVNMLYALHEALRLLLQEGLQQAWARHRHSHELLAAGIADLGKDFPGLEFLVASEYRLPQLNTICVPDGVDEAAVRRSLMQNHSIEIGAGLGPLAGKVWRIGLMGAGSRPEIVARVLAALAAVLQESR